MTFKVLALIRMREREELVAWSRRLQQTAHVLLPTLAVDHCVVNVADRRSPWGEAPDNVPPLYDAIFEVPLQGDATVAGQSLAKQLARNADVHIYLADQAVQKSPAVDSTPSINLMAVWDAKPGQAAAETRRHWLEHVPLALSIHHGVTRYVQSWLAQPLTVAAPAHAGVATLRFPSMEAMATGLFRSAEDVATIDQDVSEFIQASHVMYTTETVVFR
jgi:hypothetical protein